MMLPMPMPIYSVSSSRRFAFIWATITGAHYRFAYVKVGKYVVCSWNGCLGSLNLQRAGMNNNSSPKGIDPIIRIISNRAPCVGWRYIIEISEIVPVLILSKSVITDSILLSVMNAFSVIKWRTTQCTKFQVSSTSLSGKLKFGFPFIYCLTVQIHECHQLRSGVTRFITISFCTYVVCTSVTSSCHLNHFLSRV